MMATDTIVAPSTPYGFSGLAVVRLSGPRALEIVRSLISGKASGSREFAPRQATLAALHHDSLPIDEAVITYFQAPHSYTGEDLVEISCHGNPTIIESLLAACGAGGARPAEPGEFTRRAFLQGKLDLVQAESVAGLIHAQSQAGARLNLRLLRGRLSERLQAVRQTIIDLLARTEFELDISEEDLDPDLAADGRRTCEHLLDTLSELLATYRQGRLLSRGAAVVIVGAPNVGKSTLLNALTESDRAIVSAIPGTTRDTIDVPLLLEGVPVRLVDTAGLRPAGEELELEGIRRTRQQITTADLILAVFEPPDFDQDLDIRPPEEVPVIRIHNKADLLSSRRRNSLPARDPRALLVSAANGDGIPQLKQRLKAVLEIAPVQSGEILLTSSRQQRALSDCREQLEQARRLLGESPVALELVAVELREALDAVDALLGKTTAEDILNRVFEKFCVGK